MTVTATLRQTQNGPFYVLILVISLINKKCVFHSPFPFTADSHVSFSHCVSFVTIGKFKSEVANCAIMDPCGFDSNWNIRV